MYRMHVRNKLTASCCSIKEVIQDTFLIFSQQSCLLVSTLNATEFRWHSIKLQPEKKNSKNKDKLELNSRFCATLCKLYLFYWNSKCSLSTDHFQIGLFSLGSRHNVKIQMTKMLSSIKHLQQHSGVWNFPFTVFLKCTENKSMLYVYHFRK